MYALHNSDTHSCNHCCSVKAISTIYSKCVLLPRYPACNVHAPHCHLWPVQLYNIFPNYLTNGTIFEKSYGT